MQSIWMGVAPSSQETRVLAITPQGETLLKARLRRMPRHHRAMGTLFEAIALWQGTSVRAALCADEVLDGSDTTFFRDAFGDDGAPLYTLAWVPASALGRRPRRHDLGGMGSFADLEALLRAEVAR